MGPQNVDQKSELRAGLTFLSISCHSEDDPEEYIRRVETQDDTWVSQFDPEAKQQSNKWKHPGSTPPKKFKRASSFGIVRALS